MKLIMMGPQGSGKGTQAKKIAKEFNIPHVSTGDLFRKNISEKTELGELAYVEFPAIGDTFSEGESMGIIEALKAVSDFYAPFDCEIVELNSDLEDDAAPITEDCYGAGWMVKVKPTNGTDPLITNEEYAKIVEKDIEEGSH